MSDWPEALFISVMTIGVVLCVLFAADCEKHRIDHDWDCIGKKSVITK